MLRIIVLLLSLTVIVALSACSDDAAVAPAGAVPPAPDADKLPCRPIAVTYEDPRTVDPDWSGGIKDFTLVESKSVYHLFHITDPATAWTSRDGELTLGHATSADLGDWQTQHRIDLRTAPGGWSPTFTWAPHVIRNEKDGRWYMFYTGVSWPEDAPIHEARQRVGLAVSDDLFHWERYDGDGRDGLILDGPDHEQLPWSAYDMDHTDAPWEYDCRDPYVYDRGPGHGDLRYVMLNSVRLAPDAQLMAIALAASGDLLHWEWLYYLPVTVGESAESANLLEHDGNFYLFWTVSYHSPGVKVACSTTGIFGDYQLVNGGYQLFGLGNETFTEGGVTRYLAFDDAYTLHIKRRLALPDAPDPAARLELLDFTACSEDLPDVFGRP
jgi:hypothetical protein